MKTTAAVLVELGKPLEIVELDIPALKPGQILVEINWSGMCHTQLLEARGHRGQDPYLPHCLGHEGSGKVLEIAPGHTGKFAVNDNVILSWIRGSGANVMGSVYGWASPTGKQNVNAGAITTFMTHAIISENRLTKIPKGVSMQQAVMLGCALPTGVGSVINTAKPRPGESLVVFGCGGVGLNAIMGAVVSGCAPVIAVDINDTKLTLARELGATHTINSSKEDVLAIIKSITEGGADFSIEATGIPFVMQQALQAVRPQGGKAIVIGNAKEGQAVTIDPGMFNSGRSMLGTWGGDSVPDRDYPLYGRLIAHDRLHAEKLFSAPYSLSQINQALDDLEAGIVCRPLIDMSL